MASRPESGSHQRRRARRARGTRVRLGGEGRWLLALPAGYVTDGATYYEIVSTAAYSGQITICLPYAGTLAEPVLAAYSCFEFDPPGPALYAVAPGGPPAVKVGTTSFEGTSAAAAVTMMPL